MSLRYRLCYCKGRVHQGRAGSILLEGIGARPICAYGKISGVPGQRDDLTTLARYIPGQFNDPLRDDLLDGYYDLDSLVLGTYSSINVDYPKASVFVIHPVLCRL